MKTENDILDQIKALPNSSGSVELSNGVYEISQTMDIQTPGPLSFCGDGLCRNDGWDEKTGTKLKWVGPDNLPMFRTNGIGISFEAVTLDGMNSASIGIQTYTQVGAPSSALNLEDVSLRRFKTACVKTAEVNGEGGNDFSRFSRVQFNESGAGFICAANQSVIHSFYDCQFGNLDVALDIQWGGSVNVFGGACTFSDLMLRVGQTGHNSGQINFYGIKIEPEGKTQLSMRLVEALVGDGVFINLNGLRMSNSINAGQPDLDATLFKLGPGVTLNTSGCHLKHNGNWLIADISGGLLLSEKDAYFSCVPSAKTVHVSKGRATFSKPLTTDGHVSADYSITR